MKPHPKKPLPYKPPAPATLTPADLEAIRQLVSAEIERHLRNLSIRLGR